MKAREIMSSPAITIPETGTLEQAAKLMIDKRIGGLASVREARVPTASSRGMAEIGVRPSRRVVSRSRGVDARAPEART